MTDTIISVENLGKKYRITHQAEQRSNYRTAREAIANGAKNLVGAVVGQGSSPFRSSREEFWALKDVSFDVQCGQVLGIIGRNGAGKSTLLKILSRITEPSQGRITLRGRVASLLEVGTGFHPELTGRENIYLNGAVMGMTRAEIRSKFDEMVAFAGVEKFLDTPVKRYSSGMYVRLAFGVAAHLDPEILIVDEVLAVGDAEFQKKCLSKMHDVTRGGRTVLFVSHNTLAVRTLCHRTMLLEHGSIAETGGTAAVIDKYLNSLHAESTLDIDLQNVRRIAGLGARVRIDRIRINQGIGLWHGQQMEIEFEFTGFEDAEDVAFAIGFCNVEGVRILTIDSDLEGERWTIHRGQKGLARFRIPKLFLEPDHYLLDVGCRSGDHAALEYLPQCAQVLVVPSESTPALIAMSDSLHGGFRLPGQWDLEALDNRDSRQLKAESLR